MEGHNFCPFTYIEPMLKPIPYRRKKPSLNTQLRLENINHISPNSWLHDALREHAITIIINELFTKDSLYVGLSDWTYIKESRRRPDVVVYLSYYGNVYLCIYVEVVISSNKTLKQLIDQYQEDLPRYKRDIRLLVLTKRGKLKRLKNLPKWVMLRFI